MAKSSTGSQYDTVSVKLPKGTKERIKKLSGKSEAAYISELVLRDLNALERRHKSGPDLFII